MTLLFSALQPVVYLIVIIFNHTCLAGQDAIESAERRIAELRSSIARHDRLYYEAGRPVISDAAYDRLVAELAQLENRRSETGHRVPMLSLRKAQDATDVVEFYDRVVRKTGFHEPEIALEPKIDGMAVSLVYIDGRFERGLTRGSGLEGKDISEAVRLADGFRETLSRIEGEPAPSYLELRGELYIRPSDFKRINADRIAAGQSPFSTERNLAAGTVLSDDREQAIHRNLHLAIFGWGAWDPVESAPSTQLAFLDTVRRWGLPAIEFMGIHSGRDSLLAHVATAESTAAYLDLPLDGIVLKINDVELQRILGRGADSPNWALAYKFKQPEVAAKLLGVTFQISRTGRLNPVALLEPVTIKGRTITRASLHNWRFIREHDLRLGDSLVLELSGDVIPRISGLKVIESKPGLSEIELPTDCPECGDPVLFTEEMNSGFCQNHDCPGRVREQIVYFGRALGIRGLGSGSARRLVESGLVSHPVDLYQLPDHRASIDGVLGKAAVTPLLEAIEASREAPFHRFIHALGIPGIGPSGAEQLADALPSLDALLDWNKGEGASNSNILTARLAGRLREYLAQPGSLQALRQLGEVVNSITR